MKASESKQSLFKRDLNPLASAALLLVAGILLSVAFGVFIKVTKPQTFRQDAVQNISDLERGTATRPRAPPSTYTRPATDANTFTPLSDQEIGQRIDKAMSNPEKAETLDRMTQTMTDTQEKRDRIANADADMETLDEFQRVNRLSNRVIEAACKESSIKNGGPWILNEVKHYALRNQRNGIPREYLPESEK